MIEQNTIRAAERREAESQQMKTILNFRSYPSFNEADKCASEFAVSALSIPNTVNNPLGEHVRGYWHEREIAEIPGTIARFKFLSSRNRPIDKEITSGTVESWHKLLKPKGWHRCKLSYIQSDRPGLTDSTTKPHLQPTI